MFRERAKEELAQVKVQLWEQEFVIRQQVSSEFNEQIVEIEEKHRSDHITTSLVLILV